MNLLLDGYKERPDHSFGSTPRITTLSHLLNLLNTDTNMGQQKALLLDKVKGEFVVGTRAIPKVVPGHVVVKIHSTALNPVDWKVREYGFEAFVKEYPAVLGSDAAGTIEEVGEGVAQWKKGDRVCVASISYLK